MSFYPSPSDFSGPNPRTQRLVNGSLGTSREITCSILLSLCHDPRLCRPAICPRRDKPGSVERCGMGAHLRQGWSVQVLFSCRLLLDPSDLVYRILHHLNWRVFFWPRSIFLVHESGSKLSLASSHKRQQNKNKLRNSGLPMYTRSPTHKFQHDCPKSAACSQFIAWRLVAKGRRPEVGLSSRETTNSSWTRFSEAAEVACRSRPFLLSQRMCRMFVPSIFASRSTYKDWLRFKASNIKLFSETVCHGLSSCICLQAASTSFSSETVPSALFSTFTSLQVR